MKDLMKLKNATRLTVVLMALLAAGCSIDGWEVTKIVKECEEHGGVDVYTTDKYFVTCNDGHAAKISKGG